jgi:hypothetical protein
MGIITHHHEMNAHSPFCNFYSNQSFSFCVDSGCDTIFHLVCFLVVSEATTKSKLASLNEKLDTLERRLELLEVQVGTATANPSLFAT